MGGSNNTIQTYSAHTPSGTLDADGEQNATGSIQATDVANQHPEYIKRKKLWQTIDDCIDGEDTVKSEAETYLPRPSGMVNTVEGNLAYKSYITRAHFPDFTSKFLSGLTGITKINPPKITVPASLEYLIEDCDGLGTPLDVFFFQSVRLSLKTGRQLIFVDVDQDKNRLKLVRYNAEDVINWGVVNRVSNDKSADYFTLHESVNDADSIFSHEYDSQYRVLSTTKTLGLNDVENVFMSAVFDSDGTLKEKVSVPELMGKKFNGFPVVIIGSTDIDVKPDQIPLLGVAKCALQMYMKDADLSNAMFLTCNPTLCMSGVSSDENGMTGGSVLVGSNISITMESAEARTYYTKTDASGLAEVRLSIGTYLEEAKHAGSALLSGDQKGVESGEALRIKAASTTASLATVSQACARGFEKAIRYMAEWTGNDASKIKVEVDSDYLDNMLTPEYIAQLVKLYLSDVISHETTLEKLVEGRFLDDGLSVKDEMKKIEKKKEEDFKKFMAEEEVKHPASEGTSDTSRSMDKKTDPAKSGTSDTSRDMD